MGQYDIYLDGEGYHLAKGPDGQLLSGAAQERKVNPFTRFLGTEEQYQRTPFLFGDGCGLFMYDGSHKYSTAYDVDTRSGRLTIGPKHELCDGPSNTEWIVIDPSYLNAEQLKLGSGQEGLAVRFQAAAGKTGIRSVAVLVKRKSTTNYDTAVNFNIGIDNDAAGPKPGGGATYIATSLKYDDAVDYPWPDRWRGDDYFWVEAIFTAAHAITAGNYYWIQVTNLQAPEVYWAENTVIGSATRSHYNGSAWANGYSDHPLMFKVKYTDEIDAFPRAFCEFTGADKIKRLYAAMGYKVSYYDEATSTWIQSAALNRPIGLIVFNGKMFVAQGEAYDVWYTDGTTATTVWTQLTGQQATAFGIHDNMLWKADGASLNASNNGTAWTAAAVTVGDPGTPVTALRSHGGKLYAAKPEGICEITYPDTYPGSGTPAANLMLDFGTELAARNWLLDWHSGLYFPGYGGAYELRSGLLRNVWTDKVDETSQEISTASDPFTRPSRWAPIYDEHAGGWTAGAGATRALWLVHSEAFTGGGDRTSTFYAYDGRNWHPIGPQSAGQYAEYTMAIYLQDRGGGTGRLWYGWGHNIGYFTIPTWTNDVSQPNTPALETFGRLWTPRFSHKEKHTALSFCKAGLTSENLSGTDRRVSVNYNIDNTGWHALGTFNTSPYQEIDFPAGFDTGRSIRFELSLYSNAATEPTIVEQLDLLYQPMPEVIPSHQLIIRAAYLLDKRTGGIDGRSVTDILDALRAHVNSQDSITYLDPTGGSHTVRATALTIQYLRQIADSSAPIEAYAILSLLEV